MSEPKSCCAQCSKQEPEVELVEKEHRQNSQQTKHWFCKESNCFGHYMMGLEG